MKCIIRLSLAFCFLWALAVPAFSQTHEKYYDQFLLQYEQKKYGEMTLAVQKLMERIPDNPVCFFFIAIAYDKQVDGLSMFQLADMQKMAAQATDYYTKAGATLGGPEFKAAEPHLTKLIGDKPSKKNVDAFIELRKGEMKKFVDSFNPFIEKLNAVEKAYKECEEMVTPIAMAYPTPALLYLNMSDAHWDALSKLEAKYAPIKAQLEAIIAEEKAAGFKTAQMQELQIAPLNDDGRNLAKTWEGDFRRNKIVIYDMKAWADNTRAKAKNVREQRAKLQEIEKDFAQANERALTEGELKAIENKAAEWRKEMSSADKKFYVYLITDYLLAKAKYQSAAHQAEKARQSYFIEREVMEKTAAALYSLQDSALNRLSYIQKDSSFYVNQLPIYERYGRHDGISKYKRQEAEWLQQQHDYWGDVAFSAGSMLPTIPDQMMLGTKKALLRPSKFDVEKEFQEGALIAERVLQGDDGSMIVIGKEKGGSKGVQPVVMRFGAAGDLKWFRTFSADTLDAARIANPHVSDKGITALTCAFKRGDKEHYRIEVIANNGDRVLWREDLDLPVSSHFIHDPEGVFLYEMTKDGDKLRIGVEGFGFTSEPGIKSVFTVQGEVAKVEAQTGQLLLVINAISIEGEGISFLSKAGKGHNVALLAFKLDGSAPVFTPIYSDTPIAAEMLIPGKGNDFTLKGQQGAFRITEGGRLTDGQPWEYESKAKK